MAQIAHGVRALLSNPFIYSTLQSLTGAHHARKSFVADSVKPLAGKKVLDVGCCLPDIPDYIPAVDYWGLDISATYINHASKRYRTRVRLFPKLPMFDDLASRLKFDHVPTSRIRHHMDDEIAISFLQLAHKPLRLGGRLVTIDACWIEGQHPIAQYSLARNGGKNVHTRVSADSWRRLF